MIKWEPKQMFLASPNQSVQSIHTLHSQQKLHPTELCLMYGKIFDNNFEKLFEQSVIIHLTHLHNLLQTSKTTFNNDQPRSVKEKDLWLETLVKKLIV